MCFSYALASYSSLDRSNNGGHILELPLTYDDYFRLFDNPYNHPLNSNRYIDEHDSEEYVALDPVFTGLVIHWGVNLARKLAAASYGGQLPSGYSGVSLRPGALQEIGVVLPPLLELFEWFLEEGHPFDPERVLTTAEADYWIHVLRDNAMRTRDWILDAERRSVILGPYSGWNFDAVSCNKGAACQCQHPQEYDTDEPSSARERSRYNPSRPLFSPRHDPHFPIRRSPSHEVDVDNALGLTLNNEPDARSDSEWTSCHCYDSDEFVSSSVDDLVRDRRHSTSPDAQVAENTCRALIPHPVLGPGAQNALVPYHPPPSEPTSSEVFRSPSTSPTLSLEVVASTSEQQEYPGLGSNEYHEANKPYCLLLVATSQGVYRVWGAYVMDPS